jgi:integrase
VLGKSPNDLPVVPVTFRRLIEKLHPEQAPKRGLSFERMSAQSIRNMKALCRRAFDRYMGQFRTAGAPMSMAWAALLALLALTTDRRREYALRRWARFATNRGVEPPDAGDWLVEEYSTALESDPFTIDPRGILRRTILANNLGVANCPDWPAPKLTLTYAKEGYCLTWAEIAEISPALSKDVDRFIDYLARKGGLLAKGPKRALRPASLKHRRFQLRQAFSIYHRATGEGHLVARVGDLADPVRAATVLEFFLKGNSDKASSQSSNMLAMMISIARHYAGLGETVIEELQSYRGMVGYTQVGLTPKNRAMLRQFDSERNLGLLLHLPARVLRKLRAKRLLRGDDAREMRNAVMIELELVTAMRRYNLTRLRTDLHLQPVRTADGERLFLDLDGREVKNSEYLGYPLPAATSDLLRFYLDKCRPILSRAPQGWFFPGQTPGESLNEEHVSRIIMKTVFERTGLKLTAHAFRHLVGMVHLKENPGELEVLRRFYGHRDIDVTANNYAGFDATAAAQRVDSTILALRTALPDTETE